ncbi:MULTISPECIES: hypothetical protein [unclassified Bartonella]|uniref:hypothetical protein n=1 Tax=unclassified Bartonella TaxID=2645622 RepID=UPI0035D10EA1
MDSAAQLIENIDKYEKWIKLNGLNNKKIILFTVLLPSIHGWILVLSLSRTPYKHEAEKLSSILNTPNDNCYYHAR